MRALLATAAILSIATSAAAGSPDRPDLRAAAAERPSGPRVPPPPGSRRSAEARRDAGASQAAVTSPSRWGERSEGRWWAGHRAPGGWDAYRRPLRGWALPTYWLSPDWRVNDWATYGLPRPPEGYVWSRYYDDAVMIDARGSVHDTIGGVDWDQFDDVLVDYADVGAMPGYDRLAYAAPTLPTPSPPARPSSQGAPYDAPRRAAARTPEPGPAQRTVTSVGAGQVAGTGQPAAPYRAPTPRYGADYPVPGAGYSAATGGYPPAVATRAPASSPAAAPAPVQQVTGAAPVVVTAAPGTRVLSTTTTTPTPGYYANGYYYPGTSITTITVQGQPVTTTTNTTSPSQGRR